jgi:uncharacterized OsmC-like protein
MINISYLGDQRFKAEWNGLEIMSHETEIEEAEASRPDSILAASLGLCTAHRIVSTCKKKGWEIEDIKIKLDQKINWKEWRTEGFKLDVELKPALTPDQKDEVLKEAHRCYVHNTLKTIQDIQIHIK